MYILCIYMQLLISINDYMAISYQQKVFHTAK